VADTLCIIWAAREIYFTINNAVLMHAVFSSTSDQVFLFWFDMMVLPNVYGQKCTTGMY